MIPELIWFALLQNGDVRLGIKLAESLATEAASTVPVDRPRWYGTTSSFGGLGPSEAERLRQRLSDLGMLEQLQKRLAPLAVLYPECPLRFLWDGDSKDSRTDEVLLGELRPVLLAMFDKTLRDTTLAAATFTYLAFVEDVLKVATGLALADFPKVADYPNTERSREVAAAVRSTLPMFFSHPFYDPATAWPAYFWNRGLLIEPCSFGSDSDEKN